MQSGATTTIYFDNVENAQAAQAALENRGVSAELHTNSSDGAAPKSGGFMERVREFFGAAPAAESADHSRAAFLMVSSADDDAIFILRSYGGRTSAAEDSDAVRGVPTDATDEQSLRLHEERLSVNKEQVSEGEFRARKETVSEQQNVDVPTTREEVYVERRPLNDAAAATDMTDTDQEIRIPVSHEEVHVEKRPVTTEEIVIGKRRVQETQTVGAEVRKERVQFDSDVDVDSANVADFTEGS